MLWLGHVWCREILEELNSAAWLEVLDSVREACKVGKNSDTVSPTLPHEKVSLMAVLLGG